MKHAAIAAIAVCLTLGLAASAQAAPVADIVAPSTVGDSVTWEAEIIFDDDTDGHYPVGGTTDKGTFIGGINVSGGGDGEAHYTIDNIVAGTYELATWASNNNSIYVYDGSDDSLLGQTDGADTSGWQDFSQPPGTIEFTAGPLNLFGDIAAGDDFELWVNSNWSNLDKLRLTLVPEPATMALLGLGGLGVLVRRRRRS